MPFWFLIYPVLVTHLFSSWETCRVLSLEPVCWNFTVICLCWRSVFTHFFRCSIGPFNMKTFFFNYGKISWINFLMIYLFFFLYLFFMELLLFSFFFNLPDLSSKLIPFSPTFLYFCLFCSAFWKKILQFYFITFEFLISAILFLTLKISLISLSFLVVCHIISSDIWKTLIVCSYLSRRNRKLIGSSEYPVRPAGCELSCRITRLTPSLGEPLRSESLALFCWAGQIPREEFPNLCL